MQSQPPTQIQAPDDIILVDWNEKDDHLSPARQSVARRMSMTLLVSLIALAVTAASAIDACGVREYSEYFQVSELVGSLATGMATKECPIPLKELF